MFVLVMFRSLYQVTRLREYQGVDPHFDNIARQYHDIVTVMTKIHISVKPNIICRYVNQLPFNSLKCFCSVCPET